MNSKTKYIIPVFVVAVVFALVFVSVTPSTMAQGGDHGKWRHHHHTTIAEGFTGTITIPQEMTRETHAELKNKVTVSLGQAVLIAESNGVTDAMKASIGVVKDDNDNKYLVWKIISLDHDVESQTKTMNIFVVDAGDDSNFTSITETFGHSWMMKNDKIDRKIEKFQQKFSEPTGDAEVDAARAQFLDLLQQLGDAYANGDYEAAKSIREQLKELKQTVFSNMNSAHL